VSLLRFKWVVLIIIATILMSIMGGGIDFLFRTKDIIENRLVISPLETAQTQIGILLGVMALIGVLTLGPFGRLSDIYGRRKFIISWAILSAFFAFYAFFAYSLPSLYAIGLPRTLLFNLGWASILAWVADEVAAKERGKVLSILSMGSMIGVVVGPVFLSSFRDIFGNLNIALIAGSGVALALTIPLAFLPEPSRFEPQADRGGGFRGFREIVSDAPLLILSFSSLIIYAIGAGMNLVIVPFLENRYGLSETAVGGLIMIMGVFTGIGFILAGFLMDKWVGMRKRLVVSFLAFCGIFLIVAPFVLTLDMLTLMVTLPIQGLTLGFLFPAFLVLIADYSPKGETGTELGTFQSISTLGFFIGDILAGFLWDTGFGGYGTVSARTFKGLSFSLWAFAALAFIPIPLIMYKIKERRASQS